MSLSTFPIGWFKASSGCHPVRAAAMGLRKVTRASLSVAITASPTHLNADQFRQLCEQPRTVYLTFDVDQNQSGQQAAELLAHRLGTRGIAARRVLLPEGQDPNSFFVQGGDARQFRSLVEAALP